ncbi:glycosyltransferase family 61 protein [Candidatus Dependentiae bacterium]|nr:glycosyltransferase family 61 protein [Candidatus Dependentiae bacterium]
MWLKKSFLVAFLLYNSCQSISKTITQVSIKEFAQLNPYAQITQCTNHYPYAFQQYPLYKEHCHTRFPNQGIFNDAYIISVPNGTANLYEDNYWGISGLVFINNYFIKECQIKNISPFCYAKTDTLTIQSPELCINLNGSVAICWHLFPQCYGHFILDVLCQLALFEIQNIDYDYLCIPYSDKFMQDLLDIWGINSDKIIPYTNNIEIFADRIIIPTAVTQTPQVIWFTNYTIDFLIKHVREKLLKNIKTKKNVPTFSPKIFISRKDSKLRNIPNEDEIFKEFEYRGFRRYELSKLSIPEQILLFNNAQAIVSFVGSGSTNIIFSKPGTQYIEIVQTMVDATFFFLANIMKLNYYHIDDTTYNDFSHGNQNSSCRIFSIKKIQDFLIKNPEL